MPGTLVDYATWRRSVEELDPSRIAVYSMFKQKNEECGPPVAFMWCAHTTTDSTVIATVAKAMPS